MNVRDEVYQCAWQHGWRLIVGDEDSEIWGRGGDRVAIVYRMFGTIRNGVGWGVKTGVHLDTLIVGKNKKGQILRLLKTPFERHAFIPKGTLPAPATCTTCGESGFNEIHNIEGESS